MSAGAEEREPEWLEDDLWLYERQAAETALELAPDPAPADPELVERVERRQRGAVGLALVTSVLFLEIAWFALVGYVAYRLLPL